MLLLAAGTGCVTPSEVNHALHQLGQRAVDDTTDAAYEEARSSATTGVGERAAEARRAPLAAGQVYDSKFDFIPGERVLVFDDFGDTEVGDLPARWSLSGYGAGGAPMSVVQWEGKRWFSADLSGDEYLAGAYLRLDADSELPARFTLEFDLGWKGTAYSLVLGDSCTLFIEQERMATDHTSATLKPRDVRVEHVSVTVNGHSVKAYLGGVRTINDSDCLSGPVSSIRFVFGDARSATKAGPYLMTDFRLAEGGRDFPTALTTDGRIVTHAITFDTGADTLRPESGPTLRRILQLLKDDERLRFEIQGHTDSQGGDKVNGPLSERRAKSVMAWLVGQGIAEGRLSTRGLGATRPLSTNEKAEGRANNRRVELVSLKGPPSANSPR